MLFLFVKVLGNDVLRFLLFLNKSAETEATRTYLLSTASQAIPILQNYQGMICTIIISDKTKLGILTSTYKGTNLSKPNKLTKLRL